MSRPIVVIPSCTKLIEGNIFDSVGRQYSTAIAEVAECQPLLIPLGASMTDIGAVLEIADAILLSGSRSNVAPEHYGTDETLRPEAAEQRYRDRVRLHSPFGVPLHAEAERGVVRTAHSFNQSVFGESFRF